MGCGQSTPADTKDAITTAAPEVAPTTAETTPAPVENTSASSAPAQTDAAPVVPTAAPVAEPPAAAVPEEAASPAVDPTSTPETASLAAETSVPKMQTAFVFTKPHANTTAVRELVLKKFGEVGIEVIEDGEIDGPTIDEKKYIDQHYYAIASKATLLEPSELPVPADKFSAKFGEEWATVLADARVFNALQACKHLEIDTDELNTLWKAATAAEKLVKLGGGFYCALLEPEGRPPIYTFNAFFMSMRSKFTATDASLHYYVVQFAPEKLAWADFRGKVLGPTDPAAAPADSLRGLLFAGWEELGLAGAPNTTDNGVHASASPFEGLAERSNWLQRPLEADPFGKLLLDAGVSEETIKAWTVDPQVSLPDGSKGSLFDSVEDLDLDGCLAKCVAISKAQ